MNTYFVLKNYLDYHKIKFEINSILQPKKGQFDKEIVIEVKSKTVPNIYAVIEIYDNCYYVEFNNNIFDCCKQPSSIIEFLSKDCKLELIKI